MNRLLVTALVPALAFGAVAPAGATEAGPYVTGEFSWLIKQSFIKHLKSPIAGGTFRGQGGAAVKDGTLVFPVNSAESHIDASGNGTINLDGSAHLTAYKGFARGGGYGLDLTYSDLKIQVQGTSATLIGDYTMAGASASDTSKELSGTGDDVTILTFDLAKPITPGQEFTSVDSVTTAGPGLESSLLRYKNGTVVEGSKAGLSLKFTDTKPDQDHSTTPDSIEDHFGSSKGGLIASIIAIIAAVLGGGAFALSHVNIPALLAQAGIRI
ncbi:HtaA domain-containing protein [Corynebacterium renale]|uniref:Htaa protein n=1 Tax=Corynebacterium renale TaxID=1724 RepID=A0A2A9DM96_9CORY|nr:HtaA domain-containing protein [Corynebacterium renale]PFG27723.1 Htaa protein [Corynebacterium renale]SQI22186.1 putative cell-surface hemin receptor [Corynebacterium renale]